MANTKTPILSQKTRKKYCYELKKYLILIVFSHNLVETKRADLSLEKHKKN